MNITLNNFNLLPMSNIRGVYCTLKHNNFDLEGLTLMLYILANVSHILIIFFKQKSEGATKAISSA